MKSRLEIGQCSYYVITSGRGGGDVITRIWRTDGRWMSQERCFPHGDYTEPEPFSMLRRNLTDVQRRAKSEAMQLGKERARERRAAAGREWALTQEAEILRRAAEAEAEEAQ